ncbi:hypothetical protein BH09PSE5_BH09PSE5_41080 [soil metagenome]
MYAAFELIHNHHERPVLAAVAAALPDFPQMADGELLADVACIALNRMRPRYIRHEVDMAFYRTDRERMEVEAEIAAAVTYAYEFVQARMSAPART